ncbi:cytochrome-c oxidase, cbb3-type subunit III [Hyphomicrobium sp.]|uniref:cytochrome-c oxidase, cbb3-type subunit III n=1 Tax=Hyphomicrobium sp. TaxID=82 RepID=UPI002E2FB217|nr:cytochrome-c oxidase, cbb3-type subunit III [Hyphomicrobium sp.]HEX2842702.1 cytochrome-c oxidase, cbb3-type subunit III [Hyphomicrobium sp.]
MGTEKRDPVTGQMTTGHEWNGIEELDTPIPRVVLFFLALGILFSIGYWLLMPAWPLGTTYTKGLLGNDQRQIVTRQVDDAAQARAVWTERIATASFAEIAANETLMHHVRETGRTLFIDNCAVCHGTNGAGGPGFPNLAASAWLWGGDPEALAETIRVGINSSHPDTRSSQMMAFGQTGMLDRDAMLSVAAYVRSLSGQHLAEEDQPRIEKGKEIFAANCVACHGPDGKGLQQLGAPNLTDAHWIYGGDVQSVYTSIYNGRQGHMPHWEGRLSPVDIKLIALYVSTLAKGGGK